MSQYADSIRLGSEFESKDQLQGDLLQAKVTSIPRIMNRALDRIVDHYCVKLLDAAEVCSSATTNDEKQRFTGQVQEALRELSLVLADLDRVDPSGSLIGEPSTESSQAEQIRAYDQLIETISESAIGFLPISEEELPMSISFIKFYWETEDEAIALKLEGKPIPREAADAADCRKITLRGIAATADISAITELSNLFELAADKDPKYRTEIAECLRVAKLRIHLEGGRNDRTGQALSELFERTLSDGSQEVKIAAFISKWEPIPSHNNGAPGATE